MLSVTFFKFFIDRNFAGFDEIYGECLCSYNGVNAMFFEKFVASFDGIFFGDTFDVLAKEFEPQLSILRLELLKVVDNCRVCGVKFVGKFGGDIAEQNLATGMA